MFNPKNSKKKNATTTQRTPNVEPVQRKKRSDAKVDVKIPFDDEERRKIKVLARKHHTTPTQYISNLLAVGLMRGKLYPSVSYSPKDKKPVHAKLTAIEHEKLFDCSVEWDCSIRESAYRIVKQMLKNDVGGMTFD